MDPRQVAVKEKRICCATSDKHHPEQACGCTMYQGPKEDHGDQTPWKRQDNKNEQPLAVTEDKRA
jgi:hypothetical protein